MTTSVVSRVASILGRHCTLRGYQSRNWHPTSHGGIRHPLTRRHRLSLASPTRWTGHLRNPPSSLYHRTANMDHSRYLLDHHPSMGIYLQHHKARLKSFAIRQTSISQQGILRENCLSNLIGYRAHSLPHNYRWLKLPLPSRRQLLLLIYLNLDFSRPRIITLPVSKISLTRHSH